MDIETTYCTFQIAARKNQHQSDQYRLVENDAEITDYPINSYLLYTPPIGRRNKFADVYLSDVIEDLIRGKQIRTHIHILCP
jgi:hypothetical protein